MPPLPARSLLLLFAMLSRHLPLRSVASAFLQHHAPPGAPASSSSVARRAIGQNKGVDSLISWVKEAGGIVNDALTYEHSPAFGFGLCTDQAVADGEGLVLLPEACTLRVDDGRTIEELQKIVLDDTVIPQELWGLRLGLRLLHERSLGRQSQWARYVALLPDAFEVPMFFAPDEVAALQYPPISAQVAKRGRFLQSFCTGHDLGGDGGRKLFNGLAVDMGAVGWAFAAVTSRAFRLRGPELPASLLPLIDLCNHAFPPTKGSAAVLKAVESANCEVLPHQFEDGTSGAKLVASRAIAAGEPLLLSYGGLSNDIFLLDYGFIPSSSSSSSSSSSLAAGRSGGGNPFDTVEVSFSPQVLDAAAAVSNVDLNLPGGKLLPFQEAVLATLGLSSGDFGTSSVVHLGAGAAAAVGWIPGSISTDDSSSSTTTTISSSAVNLGVDPRLVAAARVLASRSIDDLVLPVGSSLRSTKKEKTKASAKKSKQQSVALGGAANREFPPGCALGGLSISSGGDIGALGRSGESAALRSVIGLCATALSSFPTTLDEDLALLQGEQSNELSPNMATAVAFRAAKKRHLVTCIATLAEKVRQLSKGPSKGDSRSSSSSSSSNMKKKKKKKRGMQKRSGSGSGTHEGFGYKAKYFG
jgi:hypothetical protein